MTDRSINVDGFHRYYVASKVVIKAFILGWGSGLVGKVFAKQMQRPEFRSLPPTKKPGRRGMIPVFGMQGQGVPRKAG